MEAWQIVAALYGSVLGYLCLSNIQQGKQIAVMQKSVDNLSLQVTALSTQLQVFLSDEIDLLKKIADGVRK